MNISKLAAGIGVAWLGVLAGSAQAYLIDWAKSYQTTAIASKTAGVFIYGECLSNTYNWDRSVQLWQTFASSGDTTLSGISLQLQQALWKGMNGTIDLNVYEGVGVEGPLLSSTKLEWDKPFALGNKSFGTGWFGFELGVAVKLQKDTYYTIALENLIIDKSLVFVLNDNVDHGQPYMHQAYFGMSSGRRGYASATVSAGINYILWK